MAFQPADKNSTEQDANVASNDALQLLHERDDDKYQLLPSLSSTAQTEVSLEDYTVWAFYFNWDNHIIWERTSSRGHVQTDFLRIRGELVQGIPSSIASVLFNGNPRVYYYDRYSFLSEVYLKPGSADQWEKGTLDGFEFKGNPEFGLSALSQNLPEGVNVRVRYHDRDQYYGWSFAVWLGQGGWIRERDEGTLRK